MNLNFDICMPFTTITDTHIHILILYNIQYKVTDLLITIYYTYCTLRIYIYSRVPTHLSHCLCVSILCRIHEGGPSNLQVTHIIYDTDIILKYINNNNNNDEFESENTIAKWITNWNWNSKEYRPEITVRKWTTPWEATNCTSVAGDSSAQI